MKRILFLSMICVLLAVSIVLAQSHCPPDPPMPTPYPPNPTYTPRPTYTPNPTYTPRPTYTATATVTDTPLPTATATCRPTYTPLPTQPTYTPYPTATEYLTSTPYPTPISSPMAAFYVDGSCIHNGDGTDPICASATGGEGPFNSLANARAAMVGDQSSNSLLFKRGQTFSGQFTVGAHGTAGHPFIISAYGTGDKPVISGGSNGILIRESYIIVDGLHVTGATGAWQAGINVIYPASNITIQNCLIDYCDYSGIKALDVNNLLVDSNEAAYCGRVDAYGIDVRRTGSTHNPTGIVIKNNIVHHTIDYGMVVIGHAPYRIQNVEIYGNESYSNSTGLYLYQVNDSLIYDNEFHHNYGPSEEYGIAVGGGSNNEFYDNEIYDNHNIAIQFYGDDSYGASSGNKFYRNFIYGHTEGNGHAINVVAISPNLADDNIFSYNIITGNNVGFAPNGADISGGAFYNNTIYGNSRAIDYEWWDTGGWAYRNNIFAENDYDIYGPNLYVLDHSYNLYWNSVGGTRVLFDGITYTVVDITDFEPTAIGLDPKLVNPPDDLHLLPLSPCIDAGTGVDLILDFEENPIVGLPDIGAYEYLP